MLEHKFQLKFIHTQTKNEQFLKNQHMKSPWLQKHKPECPP